MSKLSFIGSTVGVLSEPEYGGSASNRQILEMNEIWVQCFTCCVNEQPQPTRRRRIDMSMIGEPTNFRHTGHIGSNESQVPGSQLSAIQEQMASKGGYHYAVPTNNHPIAVGDNYSNR